VSLFVPPERGNENHPGIYRGRLDCWAEVGGTKVAEDYFEIEVQLAREVGPSSGGEVITATFGTTPSPDGALIYWGDFSEVGLSGETTVYREDFAGQYVPIKSGLPQKSSYTDKDVEPGVLYSYMLGIDDHGEDIMIGPIKVGSVPKFVDLMQNYPNPFRSETIIRYNLPKNGHVSLRIYDVAGRLVRTLVDRDEIAGYGSVSFDGRNQSGSRLASGIYYYRLTTPQRTMTQKMVIVR